MKTIYLTSSCEPFSYSYDNDNKTLILTWKSTFDFSNVLFVGLSKLQIIGVISEDYELLPVYCNLIERTSCNPFREIHRASIDPFVDVISDTMSGEYYFFYKVNKMNRLCTMRN